MLLRVLCVFLWCKLELINLMLSRGSPPAESAQNARPDPTHASDCAREILRGFGELEQPIWQSKMACSAAKGIRGQSG